MRTSRRRSLISALMIVCVVFAAAVRSADIPLEELLQVLSTNLPGFDRQEINRTAVRGLLQELGGRVALSTPTTAVATTDTPLVPASALYDRFYAYVRIGRIAPGLEQTFKKTVDQLKATNRLKGLVIDLRFAGGSDYAAAAKTADVFFSDELPLLDWGQGGVKSTQKDDPIALPVAVLVNRQTADAAEALAAILRERHVALLLGTNTAGHAWVQREVRLSTGQRLRVAAAPLKVADGKALAAGGLTPDIVVEIDPAEERTYYADAFAPPPRATAAVGLASTNESVGATNRSGRRRPNEADLVRMQREGRDFGAEGTNARARLSEPLLTDPALVRALDLLKGLAVVQQFRAP